MNETTSPLWRYLHRLKVIFTPSFICERDVPGRAVTRVRGFVKCFLKVPRLFFSFHAAQASKENSQEIVNKTAYPYNGPSVWRVMNMNPFPSWKIYPLIQQRPPLEVVRMHTNQWSCTPSSWGAPSASTGWSWAPEPYSGPWCSQTSSRHYCRAGTETFNALSDGWKLYGAIVRGGALHELQVDDLVAFTSATATASIHHSSTVTITKVIVRFWNKRLLETFNHFA